MKGKVYLVGAGPGDPGLITIKGLDCLKQSDVIVYDRLVDDSLLGDVSSGAEKIYVGKSPDWHASEQKEINLLLVKKAREGKTVVRLKGGDPFVLGRGGEEAEVLAANNIPFEVVPGISSSLAVPAYAGIPVTDRRFASSFTVITGHEGADKDSSSIAWDRISTGSDTLVFLMGMANLSFIVSQLMKHGRLPATPAAVISQGTTPKQQTVVGTLEDIVSRAEAENIKPPAVIVVGEVVKLRERLRWFDNLPLFGRRILVTRPERQAKGLGQLLLRRGALPVELPVIKVVPPATWTEMDQAILNLKDHDWVLFTSVNAVEMFCDRLYSLSLDVRHLAGLRIGAIGPATTRALGQKGLRPDYLPGVYTSQGIIDGFKSKDIAGSRVLLPRADIAGDDLVEGLKELGAEVHQVTAYRTVPADEAGTEARQMLLRGEIDVITFTSASTVNNLVAVLGQEWKAIERTKLACIGPNTAAALSRKGLKVDMLAGESTIEGLVQAMESYFQAERRE